MTLKDPPDAVAFEDAKFEAHLTMREKITELTKNTTCMGCHGTINPLGFSLENFDAIGRWRTKDGNKPINAVSEFATDEGKTIRLTGARDLVKFAADNPGGHRAFIHHLFHHTAKQAVGVYGPDTSKRCASRSSPPASTSASCSSRSPRSPPRAECRTRPRRWLEHTGASSGELAGGNAAR